MTEEKPYKELSLSIRLTLVVSLLNERANKSNSDELATVMREMADAVEEALLFVEALEAVGIEIKKI